ncbi:Rap1-interacting factor 1 N terminal-domain-containing protein [Blastocladiella britannica]|nr:Rap1-interacting factor 1 N terminal-domain-containing protein [Blastocladiella britannica]
MSNHLKTGSLVQQQQQQRSGMRPVLSPATPAQPALSRKLSFHSAISATPASANTASAPGAAAATAGSSRRMGSRPAATPSRNGPAFATPALVSPHRHDDLPTELDLAHSSSPAPAIPMEDGPENSAPGGDSGTDASAGRAMALLNAALVTKQQLHQQFHHRDGEPGGASSLSSLAGGATPAAPTSRTATAAAASSSERSQASLELEVSVRRATELGASANAASVAVPELVDMLLADQGEIVVAAYRALSTRFRIAAGIQSHSAPLAATPAPPGAAAPSGAETPVHSAIASPAAAGGGMHPAFDHEVTALAPRMTDLVSIIRRDLDESTAEDIQAEALKLIGFLFYSPEVFQRISVRETNDILLHVLNLAQVTGSKTTCHLSVWVLRMMRLPAGTLTANRSLIPRISETLAYALRHPAPFESTTIPTEALLALSTLMILFPGPMLGLAADWLVPAFGAIMHTHDLVRKNALEFFSRNLPAIAAESARQTTVPAAKSPANNVVAVIPGRLKSILDASWEKNNVRLVYELTELTGRHERDGMKAWSVAVVLYAHQLREAPAFINGMLKIVERYFNLKKASTKLFGYRAWSALVYAFASSRYLLNERRLRLVMIPISQSFAHDRHVQLKVGAADAWLNLIVAVKALSPLWEGSSFELVVEPLLETLALAEEPEVREYAWTVLNALTTCHGRDLAPSASSPVNVDLLLTIITPDRRPRETVTHDISMDPKWVRSKATYFFALLTKLCRESMRILPDDEWTRAAFSGRPAIKKSVMDVFKRLLIALDRASTKEIHMSAESVASILALGQCLADMVHPFQDDTGSVDESGQEQGGARSSSFGGGDGRNTPSSISGGRLHWRTDMLDALTHQIQTLLPPRLLDSHRCRYLDLEETCRMHMATSSMAHLFTAADLRILPAVHLVLLWIECWSDEQTDDAEASDWQCYWARYQELVKAAATPTAGVAGLYSILYMLDIQPASYPLQSTLEFWTPLATYAAKHLLEGPQPRPGSDPTAAFTEPFALEMVETLLCWPLVKFTETGSASSTISFPVREWVHLWDTAVSVFGPQQKSPNHLSNAIAQVLVSALPLGAPAGAPNLHELGLTTLARITAALAARYTIGAPPSPGADPSAQQPMVTWTRMILQELARFMAHASVNAEVHGPLPVAFEPVMRSIASVLGRHDGGDSPAKLQQPLTTLRAEVWVPVLEALTPPLTTLLEADSMARMLRALTSSGQSELRHSAGMAVSAVLHLLSTHGASLSSRALLQTGGPYFVLAFGRVPLEDALEGEQAIGLNDQVTEIAARLWGARIGDRVDELLAQGAISTELTRALAQAARDPDLSGAITLPNALRHDTTADPTSSPTFAVRRATTEQPPPPPPIFSPGDRLRARHTPNNAVFASPRRPPPTTNLSSPPHPSSPSAAREHLPLAGASKRKRDQSASVAANPFAHPPPPKPAASHAQGGKSARAAALLAGASDDSNDDEDADVSSDHTGAPRAKRSRTRRQREREEEQRAERLPFMRSTEDSQLGMGAGAAAFISTAVDQQQMGAEVDDMTEPPTEPMTDPLDINVDGDDTSSSARPVPKPVDAYLAVLLENPAEATTRLAHLSNGDLAKLQQHLGTWMGGIGQELVRRM